MRWIIFTALTWGALAAAASWAVVVCAAEPEEVWTAQPYRIRAILAIDAPGDLAQQLAEELPAYLKTRVNTSIGIAWQLTTELAQGPARHALLDRLESITAEDIADAASDEDKQLLVTVRATPWGYKLTAREFDRYVNRWGAVIRRSTRQRDALPEQLFQLVERAVSPLAQVRPDPDEPQRALLEMRGSDLPPSGADFAWSKPGDVFVPILRRTTRDGVLVADGVVDVPWTFLEVIRPSEKDENAAEGVVQIRSATQHPLGVRRGRIALVAIGLRADPGESVVRLQARTTPDKALEGYEVFSQNLDEKPMRPLGKSNGAGEVLATPGTSPIQTLLVKSDGIFLARVPIVPGAAGRVVVPLPDDDMRLRVAARLSAIREDMVDLVARRNIFMARVRQEIADHNLDAARGMLETLDDLPGPTQFNQTLDREAQLHRTTDQQVQRRIDSLFAQTRTALGKFLDPRPISELHEELRQAEQPATPASSEADKKDS